MFSTISRTIAVSALLCTSAAATSAAAQTIATITSSGTLTADWPEVIKCAAKPFPKLDPSNTKMAEFYFHQISFCRNILSARHVGWIAAGRQPEDDPIQPLPSSRPGEDFKTELVCDYSSPNEVKCNIDQ